MYLIERVEGTTLKKKAMESRPFGPGFPENLVKNAVRMEVWGSSFNDPGPDCCKFKLLDCEDRLIAEVEVGGY